MKLKTAVNKREGMLPGIVLACAAGAAQAEVIDIAWGGDGRFEQRTDVPAGKFVEVCGKLPGNLDVRWTFETSGPVDFNIHYHEGKDVVYPAKLSQVVRGQETLQTKDGHEYCWMWTNKTLGPVTLNIKFAR